MRKLSVLLVLALFLAMPALPLHAGTQAESLAPEPATGITTRTLQSSPSATWRWRRIRWPSRRRMKFLPRAAARSTRPSRRSWRSMLAEPQSSGIGGGAFLLYYDAQGERGSRLMTAAKPRPGAGRDVSGPERQAAARFPTWCTAGSRSARRACCACCGIAHHGHGKLPWKDFVPARHPAWPRRGSRLSPRLHRTCEEIKYLKESPEARGDVL